MITLDTLINAATLLAVSSLLLGLFYGLFLTVERGIRLGHLTYLSRVIEDRMAVCDVVDGSRVYAPYPVDVDCGGGRLCWNDLCVRVSCNGGGSGKTFVVKNCRLSPTT